MTLAELFEVRLRRDKLGEVYELIADKCGYSQVKLAEVAIDGVVWNTVHRAFNTDSGMTLKSLRAMEDLVPILARMYAREMTSEEFAEEILQAPELKERFARMIEGESAGSQKPMS